MATPRTPRSRSPKFAPTPGSSGTASTSSYSSNISNTGTYQSTSQTSGPTGAVNNTLHLTTTQGSPGTSGQSVPVSVPAPTPAGLPGVQQGSPVPDYSATIQSQIDAAHTLANSRINGALDQAEAHLAAARQRVLGQVPANMRDQTNAAFDQAHTTIASFRKRY